MTYAQGLVSSTMNNPIAVRLIYAVGIFQITLIYSSIGLAFVLDRQCPHQPEKVVEHPCYQKIITENSQAIRINAKHAQAYAVRGWAYGELGQYQKEIDDCNEAIQLNPKFARAYRYRACAYGNMGRYQRDIDDSTTAIELDPKHDAFAYITRYQAYNDLGEYEKASADWKMAILLNPVYETDEMPNFDHYFRKETDLVELNREIHEKPGQASLYRQRGLVSDRLQKYQEAVSDYTASLRLNPSDLTVYGLRAIGYQMLQKYPNAINDYTILLRQDPGNESALVSRARLYMQRRQFDKAIADCTEAIHLKPDDKQAYMLRASVYMQQDRSNKAIEDCTVAIKLDPQELASFDSYDLRGEAYSELGLHQRAIDDWSKVIGFGRWGSRFWYPKRAQEYEQLGQYARAVEDCTKYNKIVPGSERSYKLLTHAEFKLGHPLEMIGNFLIWMLLSVFRRPDLLFFLPATLLLLPITVIVSEDLSEQAGEMLQ